MQNTRCLNLLLKTIWFLAAVAFLLSIMLQPPPAQPPDVKHHSQPTYSIILYLLRELFFEWCLRLSVAIKEH